MPTVAKLVAEIDADITGLRKGLNDAQSRINQLSRQTAQAGQSGQQSLVAWGNQALTLGRNMQQAGQSMTLGMTVPLVAFGKKAVEAAVDLDSLKRGLTAVMGSSEAANKELIRLREVAKLPGLGLGEAILASTRLQAVGVDAERAADGLMAFGNAIATFGGGKQQLEAVTFQLGQMFGAGKLTMADLKPILSAVPVLRQRLAELLGTMDLSEINKKFSVEQVFDAMVKSLSSMEKMTAGPKVMLENIQDDLYLAMSKIGDAIVPVIQEIADVVIPVILQLVDAFSNLPPEVQQGIVYFALAAAVLGPLVLVAGAVVTAVGAIATAIGTIGLPIAAAILAVIALTAAFTGLYATDHEGFKTGVDQMVSDVKASIQGLGEWVKTSFSDAWNGLVESFNSTSDEMNSALDSFKGMVTSQFSSVIEWYQENWPLIEATTTDVMNAIKTVVNTVLNGITAFWDSWGSGILKTAEIIFSSIGTVIDTTIKTILDIFKFGLQVLRGDWEGSLETLKGIASRIGSAIVTLFVNSQRAVQTVLQTIATNVARMGSTLFNNAVRAGRQLIEGLVSGIRGAASNAYSTVANVAAGVIGRAKAAFGIRSPSREFEDIGKNVVQGFARGVAMSTALAISPVAAMASSAINAAVTEYETYIERIDVLNQAHSDEVLAIKLLTAETDAHRLSLQLLKTEYDQLTSKQKEMIDGIIKLREEREGIVKANEVIDTRGLLTPYASMIKVGLDAELEARKQAAKDATALTAKLSDTLRSSEIQILKYQGAWTEVDEVLEGLGIRYEDLNSSQKSLVDSIAGMNDHLATIRQYDAELQTFNDSIEQAAWNLSNVLTEALDGAYNKGFKTFFSNVLAGFQKLLFRMATEYLQSVLIQTLQRSLFGGGGFLDTIFGVTSRPSMSQNLMPVTGFDRVAAQGGLLTPGEVTLVGERGPEIFVPNVNGRVIPHHEMNSYNSHSENSSSSSVGGGSHITFAPTYIIQTNSPEEFRKSQRQIMMEAKEQMDTMTRRLK